MQRPARKRAAATLDDLGGAAKKVAFVRDDARALASAAPSKSQLKAALAVPFDALPAPATGNVAEAVLSRLASTAWSERRRAPTAAPCARASYSVSAPSRARCDRAG